MPHLARANQVMRTNTCIRRDYRCIMHTWRAYLVSFDNRAIFRRKTLTDTPERESIIVWTMAMSRQADEKL